MKYSKYISPFLLNNERTSIHVLLEDFAMHVLHDTLKHIYCNTWNANFMFSQFVSFSSLIPFIFLVEIPFAPYEFSFSVFLVSFYNQIQFIIALLKICSYFTVRNSQVWIDFAQHSTNECQPICTWLRFNMAQKCIVDRRSRHGYWCDTAFI